MFSVLPSAALALVHLVLAEAATTYFPEENLIGSNLWVKIMPESICSTLTVFP